MSSSALKGDLSFLNDERKLPVLLTPKDIGFNLHGWVAENGELIDELLYKYGGIVFRNFKINGTKHFEKLVEVAGKGEPLEYKNRSTPRTQVKGNIYTSTEYPPNETIPLHNENSYTNAWAMKLFFFCVKAAEQGGETPICDSRRIYEKLSDRTKQTFIDKKVMYVRNYGHLDLPWTEVFQTEDKEQVEAFCQESGIQFEWIGDTGLKTWQICEAVAKHPVTGAKVWFNQGHLFHVSNLGKEMAESLISSVGEDNLPRHAMFADGTPIGSDMLEEIRRVYDEETISFPWQSGDVMLLDNMLAAHGRKPYQGKREVLVGMADGINASDLK
jgi:alpha-ketoglutarate-dependent taurine dioxygenase